MSKVSFVYFIKSASNRIKIGIATHVAARLHALSVASSEPLEILGVIPGGVATERELHEVFASSRTRGEWFDVTPALLEWISRHAKPFDEVAHQPAVNQDRLRRLAEASALLKALALPVRPRETISNQIERVGGLFPSMKRYRVKSIWYEDGSVSVTDREMASIKTACGIHQQEIEIAAPAPAVPDGMEATLLRLLEKMESMERALTALRRVIVHKDRQAWFELLADRSDDLNEENRSKN